MECCNLYKTKYIWSDSIDPQEDLYATIEPFLTLNNTIKFKINIYIGVKKKLTSQQPLTTTDIKSSFNI